jgi:hypothetical protein
VEIFQNLLTVSPSGQSGGELILSAGARHTSLFGRVGRSKLRLRMPDRDGSVELLRNSCEKGVYIVDYYREFLRTRHVGSVGSNCRWAAVTGDFGS